VALSFGTVALLALIKMLTRREARKVRRDFHEEARDVARRQMKTKGLPSRMLCLLEDPPRLRPVAVRGGARDEFQLATYPPQNMK
jgi:hypothetical protein